METIVNYLFQSGLALLALYLFYRFVLRNQPSLRNNRLYLLFAPALSLVIPLLRWPLPLQEVLPVAGAMPTFQLSEVQVTGFTTTAPVTTQALSISQLLLILYVLIGLILFARLIWQLLRIRHLAATGKPVHYSAIPEATIIETTEQLSAFAFLHYIFLGRQEHLTAKERQQVLAHELAHVRLGHTYDVLYYEVLTAILWFNPLVWLLKEELRDVHEFQADAEVLSDFQPQEYTSLLAKEALYANGIPVGSYFQKPQVFRRLHMLQQHDRQAGMLRPLLTLPLILLLMLGFSASQANADRGDIPGEQASLAEVLITAPIRKATAPSYNSENQINEKLESTATHTSTLPTGANNTKQEPAFAESAPMAAKEVSTDQKPYTYVEQMPHFEGGEAEMLKYLGRNIRFPKETQEAGIDGLVVVSFVVATDGSLSDIDIVKSLHTAADKEALRVVESMSGQWNPGRQNGKIVPVRYTLPIRFALK